MKLKTIIIYLLMLFSFTVVLDVSAQAVVPNVFVVSSPSQTSDDLSLTTRVNEQIRGRVRNFSRENYNIFSQAGQVTIQGRAHSQAEADEILSAARLANGANAVVNAITVNPTY